MVDFQYKRQIRRILYSKVSLAFLFLLLFLLARSTWRLYERESETERTVEALRTEASSLSAQEGTLASRVAALKTDQGVEAALREKFRVARPGEGVIVIVDQGAGAGDTGASSSWWDRILSFFRRFF